MQLKLCFHCRCVLPTPGVLMVEKGNASNKLLVPSFCYHYTQSVVQHFCCTMYKVRMRTTEANNTDCVCGHLFNVRHQKQSFTDCWTSSIMKYEIYLFILKYILCLVGVFLSTFGTCVHVFGHICAEIEYFLQGSQTCKHHCVVMRCLHLKSKL